jgi:rhodanese-related sulfurtransferase
MKNQPTIIDVRTPDEFRGGHVAGSYNIPMNEITLQLDKIKSLPQPIILCCASGNRSGQVMLFLKNHGVECENGGSWTAVNNNLQTA